MSGIMSGTRLSKAVIVIAVFAFFLQVVNARPEYMRLYSADPYVRPELRGQCSICHVNPEGGGERNAFGRAFASAGLKITPELRQQFPDKFTLPPAGSVSQAADVPPVTFVAGSDSQAVVEINGKKFMIDTKSRSVTVVAEAREREVAAAPTPAPVVAKTETAKKSDEVYQQIDVRLINLPTAKPIAKGSLWGDFTHRFPFGPEPTNAGALFGLDGFAVPSFGFTYGVTDRLQVGAYRSPTVVGAPIQLHAGVSLADENEGHPLTAMVRVALEGRDNFQRNFTTSLELTLARSLTSKAQVYFVPTLSINNRPFGDISQNLPGENTFALGAGAAVNIRPSVALLAEANYRVNRTGRFDSTRPAFGFGIEKSSISRRHAFSLVFSNSVGTTFGQRSATRASLLGPFAEESFKGLNIGFNLSRRLF
jgi:hypothetical protein